MKRTILFYVAPILTFSTLALLGVRAAGAHAQTVMDTAQNVNVSLASHQGLDGTSIWLLAIVGASVLAVGVGYAMLKSGYGSEAD